MKNSYLIIFMFVGLLLCMAKGQEAIPTSADFAVRWDPNLESYLAGYTIKLRKSTETIPETIDVGKPETLLKCSEPTVSFVLKDKLTQGVWHSIVYAYSTEGLVSDPSDELILTVRPAELQYSFDNVNWLVDRLRLVVLSNRQSGCPGPFPRKLNLGNSHKMYRYLYKDELDPLPTLPMISDKKLFLQWDVPNPADKIVKFNIYKKQGDVFVLEGFAFPPFASYPVSSQGEYCMSAVDVYSVESQKSNSIIVELKAPTNLKVIEL